MPDPSNAYRQSVEDVVAGYNTSATGLTDAEYTTHRRDYGLNVIVALKKESGLRRYFRQFKDWMILLLLVSAVITAYLGDLTTATVLVALVGLNTVIGFVQEARAEKTMEALEKLVHPVSEVYRRGVLDEVASSSIVVGDVVRLSEGGSVPADLRLISTTAFSTSDFALTGESSPSRKFIKQISEDAPVADRHNMAYAGTMVATGEALGVVVATGMGTELGRIAQLSQSATPTRSPLQLEMANIAKVVTYGVGVLSIIVLVIAVAADLPVKGALLFAVGFACALVPQGLPAEVNTALAAAAGALAKKNALVKKLSAVETLGATHVICTDKTGTLTKNQMTVTELVVGGTEYAVTGIGYEPTGGFSRTSAPRPDTAPEAVDLGQLGQFLSIGVFASNAHLVPPTTGETQWRILGDPTEGAVLTAARKSGVDLDAIAAANDEVNELPFDSTRKLMTSIRRDRHGNLTANVKGAPESVLARSTTINNNGIERPITPADRAHFLALNTNKANRALRNLAFATRHLTEDEAARAVPEELENGLTLAGMVSMIDPIRESVPEAMAIVQNAGVRVNIVTGDYSLTAEAIARQAGLGAGKPLVVVNGTDLAAMPDAEVLAHALRGGTVFSRVAPEDKVRIVDLVKNSGHVVAVTGDGINDAPALRHANIGVAMGATGTDVAKQAAEIVLLDDSFATLVSAVREGRTIYRNITKGVLSCLTSNAAEFVVNSISLALTALFGLPLALNVMQILAIDLLGEIFPIAALGNDPEEGETMKESPRNPRARILNRQSILDILWCGLLIGGFSIMNFLLFFGRAGIDPFNTAVPSDILAQATSVSYITVLVCQFVSIIQRRSVHGFFTRYQFSNRTFWFALSGSSVIMLVILYVPFVANLFGTGPLNLADWAFVLGAAAVFLSIREMGRLIRVRRAREMVDAAQHPSDGADAAAHLRETVPSGS